jgi:hypothetical protein
VKDKYLLMRSTRKRGFRKKEAMAGKPLRVWKLQVL